MNTEYTADEILKKELEDVMGGAILELEVDKILNRGIDIGKAEAIICLAENTMY